MDKIIEFMKQPSTWSGTGIIGMLLGLYLAPDQIDSILKLGLAIIGVIEIFRNEKR